MRPRLLDLFCGAGGAAQGYANAGFEVVGVDIAPQPNYPFDFFQSDVSIYLDCVANFGSGAFDAIHASPPCQVNSRASHYHGIQGRHEDLLTPTRLLLEAAGLPWVIENVPGAPMRRDVVLCGEMFGLRLHRHRFFELGGWHMLNHPHGAHRLKGAKTNCHIEDGHTRWVTGHYADHEDALDAMGIDWMDRKELTQAIPPAYTEHIGGYLLTHLKQEVAA